jgi:catechol 2,3-dioxygenase-like lactoylglutathione lyase family enzyme
MAQLDHLALTVHDPRRSLDFYRDVVGVEGVVEEVAEGFTILTPRGLSFALLQGDPPADLGRLHFGASLADADAVRARRGEFGALGVTEVEWCDEPGYVSVKIRDPDGYVVEIAWDASYSP